MTNIIYFNCDQMRADFLGCYGNTRARTPNIDRLAAEGVRFDQCHVQHTVCTPSRCSFMTGWHPHVRGHRTLWHPLQPDEPNTLKYLKNHGYDVHWMGKNDLLAQDAFDDSVTALHSAQPGAQGDRDIFAKDDPGYWSFLYGPMPDHHYDWHTISDAIDFLHSRRSDSPPFMLYLPIVSPHCPFTCPQPWYDMYDPEDTPPMRLAGLEGQPLFYQQISKYMKLDQLDDAVLGKIRAVYMGMISYVDEMLGRLLTALEQSGLADNTSVFFFSDHGEWAGDYGLVEKWPSGLDDCLTRIPMIVRTPDCAKGHVVAEPVECLDIMPTTLELAGIECQHTHFGRSMQPQLFGAPADPERAVFAEGGYGPHEPHCLEGTQDDVGFDEDCIYYPKGRLQQDHPESVVRCTMIRTADHKLIHRPLGVSELYDLRNDPGEAHNLHGHPSQHATQHALENRLLDWYVRTSDVVPFTRQSRGYSDTVRQRLDDNRVES